jgi:hypothetical protein
MSSRTGHTLPMADDTMPDQAMADQAMADQAMADQAMPDQTMPDQTMPDQTMPDQTTVGETMAGRALRDDTTGGDLRNHGTALAGPVRERWWVPALRVLRWLLGALTLVGGLTWILLNLHLDTAVQDTVVGCVLTAGGVVLLMPHRIRLPRLLTAIAVTVAGIGGTAAGLLVKRAQTCCDFAYIVDRGWPFHWAERGAVADDSGTAYRLAQAANWQVDLVSLAGDLLIFAYAGLLLVVIVVLVRRARGDHDGARVK